MKNPTSRIRRPVNTLARLSRKLFVVSIIALLISLPTPNNVHAAAGDLDSTFGVGGKATTDFGAIAFGVVIQSDGKIVTAGIIGNGFGLIRYNADGTTDTSFGTDGKVITDFFNGGINAAIAIAMQSDGKIVAAGSTFDPIAYAQDFALARYNSDGSLDSSFGTGGKVFTDFIGGSEDQANCITLQPDGRIIAAGTIGNYPPAFDNNFAIARYNSDGGLDPSFGTGGKVVTDFFGYDTNGDICHSIALQRDGKILAAGSASKNLGGGSVIRELALARYNSGTFDICMQDDSSGNLLQFNSTTGDYQFSNCRKGWSFTGRGTTTVNFCKMRFTAADVNGSISAIANTCTNVGTASVQVNSQGRNFTISDRDMRNNSCGCQ